MPRHNHSESFNNGGAAVTNSDIKTNEGEISEEIIFADAAVDDEIVLDLDVSAVNSVVLVASKAATIKINDSAAPDQTIALAANKPLRWHDGMAHANPIEQDITSAFVTCDAGTVLKIFALFDATP